MIQKLLTNIYVRYILILIVGITIGVIFYPTKSVVEKTSKKYEQEIATLNEQHSQELKVVNESLDKSEAENKSLYEETDQKISSLTIQLSELKSKQKITTYKLVKPDGTVVERSFTENDVDQTSNTVTSVQQEFKQKIDAIEVKWSKIHEDKVTQISKEFDAKEQAYQKTIVSLQTSKVTTVNQKQFGLEGGILTDRGYYGHVTMDLWGPVYVGLQGEFGIDSKAGAGIGVRF